MDTPQSPSGQPEQPVSPAQPVPPAQPEQQPSPVPPEPPQAHIELPSTWTAPKAPVITVRHFFEECKASLNLTVEAGERFMNRTLAEVALNRPGLALAGFFPFFADKRIQVLGLAEWSYVRNLPADQRMERVRSVFQRHIPAMILTRSRHALPEMIQMAEEYKVPVLRTAMITGDFMNKATVMLENMAAPRLRVHATTVDVMGIGVLIEGPPGIGKSETALSLVERGHSLVADDITILHRTGENVIHATSLEMTRYHMEIRGLGIVHVTSLFGVAAMRMSTQLDLIVRLERLGPQMEMDRSGLSPEFRDVLGVAVPLVQLPVAAGRDLAHVVEVAARNQKLKDLGHDAAKEFNDKMISRMTRGPGGGM